MINIEKQIADEIAKTNGLNVKNLGLRFDKVVVRLFGNLRASIEKAIPDSQTVVVTVSAPIKLPTKTEYELEKRIKSFLDSEIPHGVQKVSIFQNEVSFKIVKSSSKQAGKLVGLVHNPSTNAKLLLDLATHWIVES